MNIDFTKYQGTGNDFIMIDGRERTVRFSVDELQKICHRRYGIGADGVIVLLNHSEHDFEMDYYNADGSKSFCGNGSRCAQAFARDLKIIEDQSTFLAIDGVHQGKRIEELYATKMNDVSEVEEIGEDYFIHTGSPHYIKYVEDVDKVDVKKEGQSIRYAEPYTKEGVNVNFVSVHGSLIKVRTYERGVEDETYSCGTGVTAVAISYLYKNNIDMEEVPIKVKGGDIRIQLKREDVKSFSGIWLIGPAEAAFEGQFKLER